MDKAGTSFGKFLLLWSGGLISSIGNGISAFGLSVYTFQQTGLASATALVTLFAFMPMLLLSPFAGVLADRHDRRLLMILGDSLSAAGLIYILICLMQGSAEVWQICAGVTISSIFAALLEPAYKATVTDLLTKEQYTKASGLIQLANSAKFLISPVIAGFLLTVSDIKLLLLIDIGTIFITVPATLIVRRKLSAKTSTKSNTFFQDLKQGWTALSQNKGVIILISITSAITFFLGFIETLSIPMILSFADSAALGTGITISASGILITSLLISVVTIKKNYVRLLSVSLFFAGIFMTGFGFRENMIMICIFGFLFFAMLPFANASLDYLTRTNIDNALQGRVWGLIGIISQLGYVAAYMTSGVLADYAFKPLLIEDGLLAGNVGKIIGVGSGRGAGLLIITAGVSLSIAALILYRVKSVRQLE